MDWIDKNKLKLLIMAVSLSVLIILGIIFYWGFTYGEIPPIPKWLIK